MARSNGSTETPTAVEAEASTPRISVRSRGMYTDTMKQLEESYLSRNPDRRVRWVYAPEDKQDYSKLIHRRALGYQLVRPEEIDAEILLGKSSGDVVRVGDVVLMSLSLDLYQRYVKENEDIAREQGRMLSREYYDQVNAVQDPKGRSARPIGDIKESHEVLRGPEV